MAKVQKTLLALLGLDLVSLLAVFNLISYLRGVGGDAHVITTPLTAPFVVLVFAIFLIDGYRARTDMMSLDYTSLHTIALLSAMVTTLLMTYVVIPAGYELQSSRGVIALSYITLIPITLSYRRLLYQRASNARGERSLVFLGDRESCTAFRQECEKVGATQKIIFCVVSDASASPFGVGADNELRAFADVLDDIQQGRVAVEALILRESNRELQPDIAQRLVKLYFDGLPTYTLELFHQVYWRKIPIYRLNQTWLFQEGFQIAREPVFERLKSVADMLLSALGLILASPLIILGALAVWLEDRGPCFFAQTRIGKNHVPFRLYKLRTMRPTEAEGARYTQPGDARITTVGRFLRASRLDELPQIWNVLRGDMSLIGPRAEWDKLVEDYERQIPCYYFRHLVKPGITGWAQVNYPYGANLEDTIRKLEYDLYYIRHFSFTLDASIILKTIHIMIFGKVADDLRIGLMKTYDFLVIGGGSAGYNAARVATELGRKTAVVDGARELGGLCILRGCMPSKTLLYMAEVLHLAQKGKKFGLKIPAARADLKAIHARKKRIIAEFAADRLKGLKSGKFDLIRAYARFRDAHTVELSNGQVLRAKHILIGTGSKVSVPPVPGLAAAKFWTSDEVLELDFIPKSVVVLGGGIVACELAQFLNRIGTKVTLIQRSPNILRDHSEEASGVIQQAFVDEGIELFAGTQIEQITQDKRGTAVTFVHDGKRLTRRAAHLFNALGREANTATLNLHAAGIRTRSDGQIIINRWQQTSAPHVYAAGDCSGPHEIVHVAIQQGELAARHAAGVRNLAPVDWSLLLNVVFTDPQLATIGRLEGELCEAGIKYEVASYPFNDHGKSILMDANYGYVKVLAEPKRGRILGAEIVGKDAGELIHAFSGPLAMRATVFDLLRAPWYHPTLAEIITYPLEDIARIIQSR